MPWESLKAGDTVRIFYSSTPYKGKFLLAAQGTTDAPVRICGVKGPNGERPEIDGNGAVSRRALASAYGSSAAVSDIHQARSIIVVKQLATQGWTDYPRNIQIDGLAIRRGHPNYSFTDASGATKKYAQFGACIWVDRGQNITIADNEISDCQMGIFTKSVDDGDFAISRNIRIAGNYMWGHGVSNSFLEHAIYSQGIGMTIEYNRFGPMRSGALGNQIKDRSAGTVVRYNYIEGGAHSIDLVEAEDFPIAAKATPAYRSTWVYGNLIKKNGTEGSFIHYGGDHYGGGSEGNFRKGTLYFFNNTIYATGSSAWIFQLSTTEEKAEVWNNIIAFSSATTSKAMRMNSDVSAGYTSGGNINYGRNWITSGWGDGDPYHAVPGTVTGTANIISGATAPIDLNTFVPLAGSAVVDAGVSGPSAASAYPVGYQTSVTGVPTTRKVNGAAIDLGGIER